MNMYQFHFLDSDGRRPVLDFNECPDDAEAARVAFRHLAQHLSCAGVEVYDGERLVAFVAGPLLPDELRLHADR